MIITLAVFFAVQGQTVRIKKIIDDACPRLKVNAFKKQMKVFKLF